MDCALGKVKHLAIYQLEVNEGELTAIAIVELKRVPRGKLFYRVEHNFTFYLILNRVMCGLSNYIIT